MYSPSLTGTFWASIMVDRFLLGVGILYSTRGGRFRWETEGMVTAGTVVILAWWWLATFDWGDVRIAESV